MLRLECMFLYFIALFGPGSVLCRLRKRLLHATDYWSGKNLQLYPYSFMWYKVTSSATGHWHMSPKWQWRSTGEKKTDVHGVMECSQKIFMLVWHYHQLLSGSHTATCYECHVSDIFRLILRMMRWNPNPYPQMTSVWSHNIVREREGRKERAH